MTKLDELKAEKKKLEAEKAELEKKVKAKKKKVTAAIDTKKTVAKKQKNEIPAFMAKEAKY